MGAKPPPPPPPRQRRVGSVLPVQFRNAGQFLLSYAVNLSRGGIFLSTAEPAARGSKITLALELPGDGAPTHLDATVRWVRSQPTEEGPPGMGLSFDDVDAVLGHRIDEMIAAAAPMRIDLVGRPDRAFRHIGALVRALVTCTVNEHELSLEAAPEWTQGTTHSLASSDLVIVDLDAAPDRGLALLQHRPEGIGAPSVLALCSGRNVELRHRAGAYVHVLPTPVDADELQTCVLATLAAVPAGASQG